MTYAYTPETLAALWDVSAATVRNLVRKGALRSFRIGRQIRIRAEAVRAYEDATCQNGDLNSTAESMPPSEPARTERNASRFGPPVLGRRKAL